MKQKKKTSSVIYHLSTSVGVTSERMESCLCSVSQLVETVFTSPNTHTHTHKRVFYYLCGDISLT